MKSARKCILTINGCSSSIRFAVYETGETLRLRLNGKIDRIGLSDTNLSVNDPAGTPQVALISSAAGRVKVRVIRTDEELMIAKSVSRVLKLGSIRGT